ncbi:bifunctional folylpolyglutamate synthase/ dihydrofolate synthase [compost metagenome]
MLATLEGGGFRAGPDATAACFSSPEAAFRDAMERATENDRILVFGSFYTVAGVMAYRATQAN